MANYTRRVEIAGKTAQELYEKIETEIVRLVDKVPLGKFELQKFPDRKEMTIKASMASASVKCLDGALQFEAKLGLLALPFKSKLDDAITRWASKTFSG